MGQMGFSFDSSPAAPTSPLKPLRYQRPDRYYPTAAEALEEARTRLQEGRARRLYVIAHQAEPRFAKNWPNGLFWQVHANPPAIGPAHYVVQPAGREDFIAEPARPGRPADTEAH